MITIKRACHNNGELDKNRLILGIGAHFWHVSKKEMINFQNKLNQLLNNENKSNNKKETNRFMALEL